MRKVRLHVMAVCGKKCTRPSIQELIEQKAECSQMSNTLPRKHINASKHLFH